MKSLKRLLAIVLVAVMMLGGVFVAPVKAEAATNQSDFNYTKKIVSVVYDDSGSMKTDNRYMYAKYAIQTLISLLSKDDILIITPMNKSVINVDLTNPDRNGVISEVVNKLSTGGGTPAESVQNAVQQLTTSLDEANKLTENAKDGVEHWLVVLTDGEFSSPTAQLIESNIKPYQSLKTIYLGMGSSAPILDSSHPNADSSASILDKYPFFFPYQAKDAASIVSAMQDVANKLSGRYSLDPSMYEVNGNKLTIDLDKAEFAFKSVSVIAQNCGATISSVTYNGSSQDLSILNPCVLLPDNSLGMKAGYSAVFERTGNQFFSGGKLAITFSANISKENLTVLAEPALEIRPIIEYDNNGTWTPTDMQFINSNLKAGDKIKIGYEVYDRMTGNPVEASKLNVSSAKATYADETKNLPMNNDFYELKLGNNMIAVSVTILGDVYSMYASLNCIIETEPTYYRVEGTCDSEASSSAGYANATYTIFANNAPISASVLNNSYKYKIIATAPDGSEARTEAKVNSNGTVGAKIYVNKGMFGDYDVKFVVTRNEDESTREYEHRVSYYPSTVEIKGDHIDTLPKGQDSVTSRFYVMLDGVKLTKAELEQYNWEVSVIAPGDVPGVVEYTVSDDGTTEAVVNATSQGYGKYQVKLSITLTENFKKEQIFYVSNYPTGVTLLSVEGGGLTISEHQALTNEKPIKFELSADGIPFAFINGFTTLRIMVGDKDVTEYAVINGNILTYAPRAEHFGGTLPTGEYVVTVKLESSEAPQCAASATDKFNVTPTHYAIAAIDGKNTVNRFRLGEVDAVLYYVVLRDGTPLPFEELKAAYENGEINVSDEKGKFGWQFWLPCGKNVAVEQLSSGEAVIAFRVTRDWIKPFDSYAAMLIFNGDNPITVSYKDATLSQSITFTPSSAWSYIWRILVILLIIHTTLYIIGFFNGKCKNLPSGLVVYNNLGPDGATTRLNVRKRNCKFWEKYSWHIWRFFPHKKTLWYHQPPQSLGFGGLKLQYNGKGRNAVPVICTRNEMVELSFYPIDSKEGEIVSAFMQSAANYKKGPAPRMKEAVRVGDLRDMFQIIPGSEVIERGQMTSYSGYYGIYDAGNIKSIVFFVKRR